MRCRLYQDLRGVEKPPSYCESQYDLADPSALLGELSFQPSSSSSFSLPRAGGISYAAQDSWVMADTIRNNITFGTPYDAARYQMVIKQCALERDLELFAAGDATELGDKGLNASGGQKARISLARAFYAKSKIILLDDVLSALDVHTTQFIVDNLFRGDLAKDRTILLVTHHVSLVRPVADFMVTLTINGEVASQGPVERTSSSSASETPTEDVVPPVKTSTPSPDGKLVVEEEKGTGRVSRTALYQYFAYSGGVIFWSIFIFDVLAGEFLFAYCNYFLGLWSKAYDRASSPSEVNIAYYLGIYCILTFFEVFAYNSQSLMWCFGALRSAKRIHANLVDHVLGANMRFLDQTPVGRLIGRFTKDMKSVDTGMTRLFVGIAQIVATLSLKFILLIWLVPAFAPYAVLTGVLGLLLGEFYIKAQLSIKREMSNAKTPVYTHFSAASHGLVSIRAYGAEERLKTQLGDKADVYTATATVFYDVNRWISVRIDLLGALFAAILSACLVYGPKRLDVFILGFAINQAISFAECILHFVRMMNVFEVEANGLERIGDYLVVEQEAPITEKGKPPASWPTDGSIEVKNLSARYYPGGPVVLRDVSFDVASGERVGIVGRTGSGKSTMTLALLRMIPIEGEIRISNLNTKSINLDALRSQVTIIPQDPVLLAGTLRYNLDPFDVLDDTTLNQSLDMSGLRSASLSDTTLTLETNITSGGSNLSSGQRQLVSLARALCRNSAIMILDEATASVDFKTDTLVQRAIRELKGVTILTVAHRLSTVMDHDKIAVLDAGRLVEFGSPKDLLETEGVLRGMVDGASNKEELERLAGL
jgi:ABC-type multidrug transport system fused ATPase/permease subunit